MDTNWFLEDGIWVHGPSEMGIEQNEEHGDWVAVTVEGDEVGPPFETPDKGKAWVDAEYAANPRHSMNWSV